MPELLQYDGTPQNLAAALDEQLRQQAQGDELEREFLALHKQLACGADRQAAAAVIRLMDAKD